MNGMYEIFMHEPSKNNQEWSSIITYESEVTDDPMCDYVWEFLYLKDSHKMYYT